MAAKPKGQNTYIQKYLKFKLAVQASLIRAIDKAAWSGLVAIG